MLLDPADVRKIQARFRKIIQKMIALNVGKVGIQFRTVDILTDEFKIQFDRADRITDRIQDLLSVFLGEEDILGKTDRRFRDGLDRALGIDIKETQRIDLVVKEFDTERPRVVHGKNIDDRTADRIAQSLLDM